MANAGIIAELFEGQDTVRGYEVSDRVSSFLDSARDLGLASDDGELWKAVWDDDFCRVQSLLDEGANPNSVVSVPCHGSKKYFGENGITELLNQKDIDPWTVSYDARVSILMYATVRCSPEVVAVLVSSGADADYVGVGRQTPLHFMLDLRKSFGTDGQRACARIAGFLVKAGANIYRVDDHGDTALIAAVDNGQDDVVKLLVEKGADVNWRGGGGRTALIVAAREQNPSLIGFLIDHGADMEVKTENNGYTAFLAAVFQVSKSCVNALIGKGANIYATDKNGWSALDILEYRYECVTANSSVSSDSWLYFTMDKDELVDLLAEKGVRYASEVYEYKNKRLEEKYNPKPKIDSGMREMSGRGSASAHGGTAPNVGSGGAVSAAGNSAVRKTETESSPASEGRLASAVKTFVITYAILFAAGFIFFAAGRLGQIDSLGWQMLLLMPVPIGLFLAYVLNYE